jgi:uncharacterized protein (DUF1684 family)
MKPSMPFTGASRRAKTRPPMPVRPLLACILLLTAGCGAPPLPSGFTVADATAFQRQHEEAIAAPLGPLAAVASHYIGHGQTLVLRVADGQVIVGEGPGPAVRIEGLEHGARCLEGCGPTPTAIEGQATVTLDRFSLLVSPQSASTRVLVHDPETPARKAFDGLPWFPVDARFIVPARFEPDPERPTVELATSRGLAKSFVRAGILEAELLGEPVALVGYQPAAVDGATPPPLLVPFTDATTGDRSYPVGRYLEVALPESGPPVLDLNRATNPWCAYSEHYNCPIPPSENRVAVAVEAGEQVWPGH